MPTGIFTLNGKPYIEKFQVFPYIQSSVASGVLYPSQRVALPGTYIFRLKALARDVLTAGGGPRLSRPFLFRLGGSNDSTWYTGGAVPLNSTGTTQDRVLDTNIFGSGAFPNPIVPDILYQPNSQITFDIQDVSQQGPYDIHIAFIGAYLVPVADNSVVGST